MDLSRIEHILACTDGSPAAARAADCAVRMAHAFGARVTLLRVGNPASAPVNPPGATDSDAVRARAEELGVPISDLQIEAGDPRNAILDAAGNLAPDLICVGRSGQSGIRRMLLGSTTLNLVREGSWPILVLGEQVPVPAVGVFRRILVPVDFSEPSRLAAEDALKLVPPVGATVELLHVVDCVHWPPYLPAGWMENVRDAATGQIARFAAALSGRCATGVIIGAPYRSICDRADERACDLILLAGSGIGALERWMVGSVTERTLGLSRKPVLVVPADRGA